MHVRKEKCEQKTVKRKLRTEKCEQETWTGVEDPLKMGKRIKRKLWQ